MNLIRMNMKSFLAEIDQNTSDCSRSWFFGDKYIHYYEENGQKLLAFIYQVVNNKIIVMGEPIGREDYLDKGLRYFVEKCEKSSWETCILWSGQRI